MTEELVGLLKKCHINTTYCSIYWNGEHWVVNKPVVDENQFRDPDIIYRGEFPKFKDKLLYIGNDLVHALRVAHTETG